MEREKLLLETPTAQVRILAEEILRDGKPHSRKEVVDYIIKKGMILELKPFREGHLAGGFREATTNLKCEKIGRGKYQATLEAPHIVPCNSRMAKAADVCETAWQNLTVIGREMDFFNADEAELHQMNQLKECIKHLQEYEERFKRLQEEK